METKDNLYAALSRAQAKYKGVEKSGANPHFRSKFSTIDDLINATRQALTAEGLSVLQYLQSEDGDYYLITKLCHDSSTTEVSKAAIYLKDKTDLQKLGSAMSYLKRYNYASICGIGGNEIDDDGESSRVEQENKSTEHAKITEHQLEELYNELEDYPVTTRKIKKWLSIELLEDMPAIRYESARKNITAIKEKLRDQPKEEW
jgi:hypothetical protein